MSTQDTKNEYYEQSIEELKKHAETSNLEVGFIQKDVAVMKTDIGWLKEEIKGHSGKLWAILLLLLSLVIGFLIKM